MGRAAVLAAALLICTACPVLAAEPPGDAPSLSAPFDPLAATNDYLATVAGEQRARSDAYFEGGYWLLLWNCLLGIAVNLAILGSGLSRRMRDLAARLVPFAPARTFLYWVQYLALTSLALFPFGVYRRRRRRHLLPDYAGYHHLAHEGERQRIDPTPALGFHDDQFSLSVHG